MARGEAQQKRFGVHRRHVKASLAARRQVAEACRFKLVSYPAADKLLFIDEYHYRAESQALIAKRFAEEIA